MRVTRKQAIVGLFLVVVVGALALEFICRPMFALFLRTNSTVYRWERPPGARLSVAVYRYPRLGRLPQYLGFGEGYMQLLDSEIGKVYEDVVVEDLAAVNAFAWAPSKVIISGIGEWEYPYGYSFGTRVIFSSPPQPKQRPIRLPL